MKQLKYSADFLTFSRVIIAVGIAWIGWSLGLDGVRLASLLMVISWGSDVLDGYLARRSQVVKNTWIGDHDLYFDMSVALGLLIFMTTANLLSTSTSVIYVVCWILVFSRFGILSVLGKMFQAPIYTWFIISAFRYEPLSGWLMLIFLTGLVAITWPRFPQDTIPSFLSGFKKPVEPSQGPAYDPRERTKPEEAEKSQSRP